MDDCYPVSPTPAPDNPQIVAAAPASDTVVDPKPVPAPPKAQPWWVMVATALLSAVLAAGGTLFVNPKPAPPAPLPEPTEEYPLRLPIATVVAPVGQATKISYKSVGDVRWIIPPELESKLQVLTYPDHLIIIPNASQDGQEFSLPAVCMWKPKDRDYELYGPDWLKVRAGTAPKPVVPIPVTPTPVVPVVPVPAKGLIDIDGPAVLIVYETADLSAKKDDKTPKMPKEQISILYSKLIADYLDEKCATGPDGKTREWRIYDKDLSMAGETKAWRDAMLQPRDKIPWLVISPGKTKPGFKGELPANTNATLTLLKQWLP